MTLDEVLTLIEQVNEFDETELGKASLQTPVLHGKLIGVRARENATMRSQEMKLEELAKKAWIYYSGKADPQVYKDKPFELRVMKGDLEKFIETDSDVVSMRSKIEVQKIKIQALDDAIKMLSQRIWAIKNAIEWQKMQNGII